MNRQEKIQFLKGIRNGTRSINELLPKIFHLTMFRQDEGDPDYLIQFAYEEGKQPERISKADFENGISRKDKKGRVVYTTLNI